MEDNRPIPERIDEALQALSALRGSHSRIDYCRREIQPAYGGPKDCMDCDDFDEIEGALNAVQQFLEDMTYEAKDER